MTTVTFHSSSERIDGFVVEGHSGYAEAGADIVCAAVSAAVGLTECTINEVLGLGAPVKAREEAARILADKAYLESVYRAGAEKASYTAEKTLRKVYRKIGFAAR